MAEDKLKKLNREYEQLKSRRFQVRRGRNNRMFCKSMAKTIYDYDTQDESNQGGSAEDLSVFNAKVGQKRSHQESNQGSYLEKLMLN